MNWCLCQVSFLLFKLSWRKVASIIVIRPRFSSPVILRFEIAGLNENQSAFKTNIKKKVVVRACSSTEKLTWVFSKCTIQIFIISCPHVSHYLKRYQVNKEKLLGGFTLHHPEHMKDLPFHFIRMSRCPFVWFVDTFVKKVTAIVT